MYLTSYEPWSLFDRMWGLNGPMARDGEGRLPRQWTPAVDIEEQADRYLLRVDLPGVSVEDIDITVENGSLKLSGERREEKTVSEDGYRRLERVFGHFERQFSLPDTADEEKVEAKTNNGVLEISIAKKETSKPRRISIQNPTAQH